MVRAWRKSTSLARLCSRPFSVAAAGSATGIAAKSVHPAGIAAHHRFSDREGDDPRSQGLSWGVRDRRRRLRLAASLLARLPQLITIGISE